MRKHISQTGDTIVEVLIAITIVSMVLGGAFVSSNRSLKSTRQAHEHAVALKLAESQLEQIKNVAGVFTADNFCLAGGAVTTPPPPTACTINNGIDYKININRSETPLGSDHHVFTVQVTWENIHGNAAGDQVTLVYGLNK